MQHAQQKKKVKLIATKSHSQMQIFVKTLENKSISLSCSKETTIDQLKKMIETKEGVPTSNQRLIYQAKQLEGSSTLGECGVESDRTIHLLLKTPTSTNTLSSKTSGASTIPPPPAGVEMNSLASLFASLSENKNKPLSLTPEQIQLMLSSQFVQQQQQQQTATKIGSGINKLPSPSSSSSTKNDESNFQQYFVDLDEPQKSPSDLAMSDNNMADSDDEGSSDDEFEEVSHTDSNGEVVKKKQKRGKRGCYTKRACSNCRLAHAACDAGRPCKRCVTLGKSDTCVDAQRKRTKKRPFTDMNTFSAEKENLLPSMTDYIPMLGQIPSANLPPAAPNSSLPSLKPLPMNPFALFPSAFPLPLLNLNFPSLPTNSLNNLIPAAVNTATNTIPTKTVASNTQPTHNSAQKQTAKDEIDEFEAVSSDDHMSKQIEQQLIDQSLDSLNLIDDPPISSSIALDLSTPQTPLSAITGSTEFSFNLPATPSTPTSAKNSATSNGNELVPHNYFQNNNTISQGNSSPEQLLTQFLVNNSLATPQQNSMLIQHLLYAYSKQSQELNDLKDLVKQLHQMVFTSSMANFALTSRLPNNSLPKIQ